MWSASAGIEGCVADQTRSALSQLDRATSSGAAKDG
jgi:hypothetical protein